MLQHFENGVCTQELQWIDRITFGVWLIHEPSLRGLYTLINNKSNQLLLYVYPSTSNSTLLNLCNFEQPTHSSPGICIQYSTYIYTQPHINTTTNIIYKCKQLQHKQTKIYIYFQTLHIQFTDESFTAYSNILMRYDAFKWLSDVSPPPPSIYRVLTSQSSQYSQFLPCIYQF